MRFIMVHVLNLLICAIRDGLHSWGQRGRICSLKRQTQKQVLLVRYCRVAVAVAVAIELHRHGGLPVVRPRETTFRFLT